jgi:hypothetical protein
MREQIAIEQVVTGQLERMLTTPGMTEETKVELNGCIKLLAGAIESECPICIINRAMAYGPPPLKEGEVFIACGTPNVAFMQPIPKTEVLRVATKVLGKLKASGAAGERGAIWATLVDAVEDKSNQFRLGALFLSFRYGQLEEMMKIITDVEGGGMTPVIVVMAFKDKDRGVAAGITGVITLPATIEQQIKECEQDANDR